MDNHDNNINLTPEDGSFSVDAILAEYVAERTLFEVSRPTSDSAPEPDSAPHRIIYDSREQAIEEAQISSDDAGFTAEPILQDDDFSEFDEAAEPVFKTTYSQTPARTEERYFEDAAGGTEYSGNVEYSEKQERDNTQYTDEKPSESNAFNENREGDYNIDELIAEAGLEEDENVRYAPAGKYTAPASERQSAPPRTPDFRERFIMPVLGLIAASSQRREQHRREEAEQRKSEKRTKQPELRADRAAAFYAAQIPQLQLRCLFASFIAIVLLWLSIGLPAAGLLGQSPNIKALTCLVLQLVAMVISLDVVSIGALALVRKKPGAESLILLSCVCSAADAIYIAVTGDIAVGLPFCAVSVLSLVFALWGNLFTCRAFAISFETASRIKTPNVVLSRAGLDREGAALTKLPRPVSGFVHSAEGSDVFESAHRLIAPILIVASIILSLFVFVASKKCDNFIHTLSAAMAASASLSAVFGFAFLYYTLAKSLAKSGVAIAGYTGAAELGRIRRVLISDADVFPSRTLSIADIAISESARPDTTISYTGSMIAAAGLGVAPVFTELMRKNAYIIQKVEDFACHEGGGLVARINGDLVYVGSSSFMQLMGIRLPKGANAKSAVYTAINDSLCGIFSLNYKPVASVQRALVSLLRSKSEPLFVVRDFNITPLLIKQKFRLPLDSYNFPSFADRYRISNTSEDGNDIVAAVFARGGLSALAGLTIRGRKLYNRARINVALSLVGSVFGMLIMLMLCWSGAYDSASCANLLSFMLLWLVPSIIISLGLRS